MRSREQISSIKDNRVAEARELTSASGRARLQKCLLEGAESIQWALEAKVSVEHVFYSSGQEQDTLYQHLQQQRIPCYPVSEGILKKISDTSYVVPWIGVVRLPLPTTDTMGDLVVVLDRVQDHGNIGTIIRTACAFGIRDLVSTTPTLDIYYKKIINASRGRAFDMRVQTFASGDAAVQALKQRGYQIIATSPHARDLQAQAPLQPRPIALLVGNETTGVADELLAQADSIVQIPMSGLVESLNVGVATGISLYELKFRMILTMLTTYIRTRLGRQVNVASQLIQRAFDAQVQQVTDLTGTQVVLMMILKCDQTMTLEQVGKDTGTFGDERNALLAPLFARGYIQFARNTTNEIVLTQEGERALAQLWSVVEKAENIILSNFSDQEKAQLNDYLQRMQENCLRLIGQA